MSIYNFSCPFTQSPGFAHVCMFQCDNGMPFSLIHVGCYHAYCQVRTKNLTTDNNMKMYYVKVVLQQFFLIPFLKYVPSLFMLMIQSCVNGLFLLFIFTVVFLIPFLKMCLAYNAQDTNIKCLFLLSISYVIECAIVQYFYGTSIQVISSLVC